MTRESCCGHPLVGRVEGLDGLQVVSLGDAAPGLGGVARRIYHEPSSVKSSSVAFEPAAEKTSGHRLDILRPHAC